MATGWTSLVFFFLKENESLPRLAPGLGVASCVQPSLLLKSTKHYENSFRATLIKVHWIKLLYSLPFFSP